MFAMSLPAVLSFASHALFGTEIIVPGAATSFDGCFDVETGSCARFAFVKSVAFAVLAGFCAAMVFEIDELAGAFEGEISC